MKHTKYWPYPKWSAMIFWSLFIILVIVINLMGCNKPSEIGCKNITINNTIETIKYINNTTIKEVNITCSETSRELELIRRLKFLEGQQDKYFNDSECHDDLDKCGFDINESKEDLERIEDKWKDCKNELDDCEEELNECEEC